jgi:hypothetical protein
MQHCVIKFVSDFGRLVVFSGYFAFDSFTNKSDRHDIAEILLTVLLNTITLTIIPTLTSSLV